MRLWCNLVESAFGEKRVRWSVCVGAFGRNRASVAVKTFSHLTHFMKTFYKCCAPSAARKDNAAINCITSQHKKHSFLSTLTGHTMLAEQQKHKQKHSQQTLFTQHFRKTGQCRL
jgi:hypothetical protein